MHIKFAHLAALAALAIPVLAVPLQPSDLTAPDAALGLAKREPASGGGHKLPTPPPGSKPGKTYRGGGKPGSSGSHPLPKPKSPPKPPPKTSHPLPHPPKQPGTGAYPLPAPRGRGRGKRSTDEEELVKRTFGTKPAYRLPTPSGNGKSANKPPEHPNPSSRNNLHRLPAPKSQSGSSGGVQIGGKSWHKLPAPPKGKRKRSTDEAI